MIVSEKKREIQDIKSVAAFWETQGITGNLEFQGFEIVLTIPAIYSCYVFGRNQQIQEFQAFLELIGCQCFRNPRNRRNPSIPRFPSLLSLASCLNLASIRRIQSLPSYSNFLRIPRIPSLPFFRNKATSPWCFAVVCWMSFQEFRVVFSLVFFVPSVHN